MHKIHKIIAQKAGLDEVKEGEYVYCDVDFVLLNDLYSTTYETFCKLKEDKKVFDNKKCGVCFNSFSPLTSERSLKKQDKMDELDKINNFKYKFDIYKGTWAEEMIENQLITPDKLIITADPHSPILGAFSLMSLCVGESDLAQALATGKIWIRVPEIVNIVLNNYPEKNVTAKDIALHILKDIDRDALLYKVVEFSGDYIDNCDIQAREVLCDMMSELGVKTCFINMNEQTEIFLERKNVDLTKKKKKTDEDEDEEEYEEPFYAYSETYEYNMFGVVPMIATSLKPEDIYTVEEFAAANVKAVDGFIGTCQGGQVKDVKLACSLLKNNKLPDSASLAVSPASWIISRECTNLGYQTILLNCNATFIKAGCSSCLAMRLDTLKAGEVCLSNCYRTYCGRMNVGDKKIYLCSALTIAASLLKGFITVPEVK